MKTTNKTPATETRTHIAGTTTDQGEPVSVYRTAHGFIFQGMSSQTHAVKSLPRGAAVLPWGTIDAEVMRTMRKIADRKELAKVAECNSCVMRGSSQCDYCEVNR